MKPKLSIVLFVLLAAAPLFAAELNSSHRAKITAFAHDERYLYSGDSSGILKVWTDDGNLVTSLQLSDAEILSIFKSPSLSDIAALSFNTRAQFILTVWNWRTGEKYYDIVLSEHPQHVSFSPSGKYLAYSSLNAFTAIYSSSGRTVRSFSTSLLGSSYFVLSASEERIMSYSKFSGNIEYRDVRAGSLVRAVSTLPGIEHLTITENTRYATGIHEHEVILVDIVSGTVLSRVSPGDVQLASAHGDYFSVVSQLGGGYTHRLVSRDNTRLTLLSQSRLTGIRGVSALTQWNRTTLLGDENGSIYAVRNAQMRTFAEAIAVPISHFRYRDTVLRYEADGKTYALRAPLSQSLDHNFRETPLLSAASSGSTEGSYTLEISEALVTLYDRRGIVYFTYADVGIQSAVYAQEEDLLIIGFSTTRNYGTSVILVAPQTTETVIIDTDIFYVVDLAYDVSNKILWLAGIDQNGQTVLEGRRGDLFASRWQEASIDAEVFSLQVHPLPQEKSAALINTGQSRISWRRAGPQRSVSALSRYYRQVHVENTLLVGLTREGTIEFVDTIRDKKRAEFFHLGPVSWLVTTPTWFEGEEINPDLISMYSAASESPYDSDD